MTGVGLVLALPDGRGGPRSLPEPGLGRGVGAVQDLAVEGQLGLQLLQVVAAVEGLGGLRENQQESVRVRGSYEEVRYATHVIPEGGHLPEADPPGAADEVGRVIRVGDAPVSVDRHVGATKEGTVTKSLFTITPLPVVCRIIYSEMVSGRGSWRPHRVTKSVKTPSHSASS